MATDQMDEIKLQPGETKVITLKGLASAGYEWNYSIDHNKNLLNIKKDFVLAEKLTSKNMGASADEVFTIKAEASGIVDITFFQKRGWEKNTEPVNIKTLKIIIE